MGIVLHMDINADWLASASYDEIVRCLKSVARVPNLQVKGRVKNNGFSDGQIFVWNGRNLCENCGLELDTENKCPKCDHRL